MYFYEVTGHSGNKITLIALKGRFHGYEGIHQRWINRTLSVLPMALKGIKTKSVLTTFASGFDGVRFDKMAVPKIGALGYLVSNYDGSRESLLTHPGMGNQQLDRPARVHGRSLLPHLL